MRAWPVRWPRDTIAGRIRIAFLACRAMSPWLNVIATMSSCGGFAHRLRRSVRRSAKFGDGHRRRARTRRDDDRTCDGRQRSPAQCFPQGLCARCNASSAYLDVATVRTHSRPRQGLCGSGRGVRQGEADGMEAEGVQVLLHPITSDRGWTKAGGGCGPPDAGEAKRVILLMARIVRLLAGKSRRGRMPSSISACATGTMFEREASRVVPWCEARSERSPLFRRASPPVPSLPLTLRERAAPSRSPPPRHRSNEPTKKTPTTRRRHRRPSNRFGACSG